MNTQEIKIKKGDVVKRITHSANELGLCYYPINAPRRGDTAVVIGVRDGFLALDGFPGIDEEGFSWKEDQFRKVKGN